MTWLSRPLRAALEDRHGPEWVAAIVVIGTASFGITLLARPHAFQTNPAYAIIRDVAPIRTWGVAMLVLAFFHLIVRIVSRPTAWVMTSLVMVLYVAWGILAMSAAFTDPRAVFPGWSFTLSMLCLYLLLHRAFSPAWDAHRHARLRSVT